MIDAGIEGGIEQKQNGINDVSEMWEDAGKIEFVYKYRSGDSRMNNKR
jgi:hypothetical protein